MPAKLIVVVGGGPAGMMAAIRASQLGQDVTLIEKNPSCGRKLLLSGKGRCNLTNACDLDPFLARFSKNGPFLRDAFKKFFNRELMHFFESRGLALKIERQMRVFPVNDSSGSILEVLSEELTKNKVRILYKTSLGDILAQHAKVRGAVIDKGKVILADKVILATGGASYKFTGSSGEGFDIVKRLGHTVTSLKPGLVPLVVEEKWVKKLEGLVLKNIRIILSVGNKEIVSDIGELLFTGNGISGPLILTLSGQVADWLKDYKTVSVKIDLKPALSKEQLDARLLREFKQNCRKSLKNTLKELLPMKLIELFAGLAKIDILKNVSQITSGERLTFVALLKEFPLGVIGTLPLEEAMVTRGGVSIKEINPRTMESRLIQGLYFAGEIINVDADTGGFNLQAAFSTGYLAGESAALAT